jgi:hypothetical protein
MSLLAQGLKFRLRTLEALTQVRGSIRLLSEPGVQVTLSILKLKILLAGLVQVRKRILRWFSRSQVHRWSFATD